MIKLARDIGVDLGTANVLVYVSGKGIVLNEPSVVALDTDTGKVRAVGLEAQRMLGRTPGNIRTVRPLRDGVIADYDVTQKMLGAFLTKAIGNRMLFRPRVMVCIPSGCTSVERRAVIDAVVDAGARKAYLIEEPMAAALGVGLSINEPRGNMVVDIGGGTTDIAILSLGGVVTSDSIRIGGDKFDDAIIKYVKSHHSLLIGERTAEAVKKSIGTVHPSGRRDDGNELQMEVRGRDMIAGLPKTAVITSSQCAKALTEPVDAIVDTIRAVMERTPPELVADIIERGIVLTGGSALMHGLDRYVMKGTGVPVLLPEDPLACVALGTGKAFEDFETLEDQVVVMKRVM